MTTTIDWNQIAVFVRVVEAGSFTAAAAALGLPKSSVSRAVSALEAQVGVRLLQRTTRKLRLTDAGSRYFQRVRGAMAGLEEATAEVANLGKEVRGTVRLSAPSDTTALSLVELIARFVQKYPGVSIEVSLTSRFVDLVEEGFDLALRGAGKLDDSALIARKIAPSELRLYAASSYLRRRGRPATFAELAAHDCVLYRPKEGRNVWRLAGPSGFESVEVTGRVSADDMHFVQSAVAAGLGISLLPYLPALGEVERVLPDYALVGGGLYIVSPSSRHEPARVTLLREFLIAEIAPIMRRQQT